MTDSFLPYIATIWVMAKTPSAKGTTFRPLIRATLPKVNRSIPVTGSAPMNENIRPIAPDKMTLPLEVLSPCRR